MVGHCQQPKKLSRIGLIPTKPGMPSNAARQRLQVNVNMFAPVQCCTGHATFHR
jgi:hypothetical protein